VITWYMCGPTVYDDSHMGHARYDIHMKVMLYFIEHMYHLILLKES